METKNKTKSVQINEDIHDKAKTYCKKRFLKMGGFIEELILNELKRKNNE
jgi:hypothetical protein